MALKPRELEKDESAVFLKTAKGEEIGTYLGERKCSNGNTYSVIDYMDTFNHHITLAKREGDIFREIDKEECPLSYRTENQKSETLKAGEYKIACENDDDTYEIESLDGTAARLVDVWETREDEAGVKYDIISCVCRNVTDMRKYYVLKRLADNKAELLDLKKYEDKETAKQLKQNIEILIIENRDEYSN